MDWTKTTARIDDKHLNLWIWCLLCKRLVGIYLGYLRFFFGCAKSHILIVKKFAILKQYFDENDCVVRKRIIRCIVKVQSYMLCNGIMWSWFQPVVHNVTARFYFHKCYFCFSICDSDIRWHLSSWMLSRCIGVHPFVLIEYNYSCHLKPPLYWRYRWFVDIRKHHFR